MAPNESEAVSMDAPATSGALTYQRALSGADVALFALVAGQVDLSGETQLSLDDAPRQPVPQALLAGLLTAAAVRATGQSGASRVASAQFTFIEQAYTDEPLEIGAATGSPDSTGALSVTVTLQSEGGRPLARGVIAVHGG